VLTVASYRFRATFRRRWPGYLSIVLLMGLVGGLAMGSIAGARRTQSSFPTFLASTNPSNLSVGTALYSPALGFTTGYDAPLVRTIAHLPHVKRAESYISVNGTPLGANGLPTAADRNVSFNVLGSVDGLYFNQDRATVTKGRMADPKKANQIVMTQGAARELGLHVGQTVPWGFYSDSSVGTTPLIHIDLTLVGTVELNNAVVQDQVDADAAQTAIVTPALARRLTTCCSDYSFTYLRLDHASSDVPAVEAEIERVIPPVLPYDFYDTSIDVTKAQNAIKPEAIALAVFGGIAALAALLIAIQLIGRQLGSMVEEERILRSLGADPAMTMSDGIAGIMGAVVIGALVAALVAVLLSPLAPLGPVRPVYPYRGFAFDWTVLGFGTLVLVVGLGVVAIALAARVAPHRGRGSVQRARRESRVAAVASSSGLPVSAVTGIRFALEPDSQAAATPVRSAILGATLAMLVVIATVIFGSSIDGLVSHPALYGWNWTYELDGGGAAGDIPAHESNVLLARDAQVSAWSGYYFGNLEIDGLTVPVLGGTPRAPVAPPILTGHGLDGTGQIVLGPGTLAQLHKVVGDSVTVSYGATASSRLQIVGTATMPATGVGGTTGHPSMGTGALVPYALLPASVRNQFDTKPAGPNAIFVRPRPGADPNASRLSLDRIAKALTLPTNYGVTLLGVQRPAEIVNYRSTGVTPAYLSSGLALGAVTALGLTLFASVRRRRRDLALLKTFGFTHRQLAATVAWQSSVAVLIGTVVGLPLGIVVGRFLWTLFARAIYAVPQPSVPALTIVLIALGALVLANIVAVFPGQIAGRTPTALLLRTE
jgi:hypothetical protein